MPSLSSAPSDRDIVDPTTTTFQVSAVAGTRSRSAATAPVRRLTAARGAGRSPTLSGVLCRKRKRHAGAVSPRSSRPLRAVEAVRLDSAMPLGTVMMGDVVRNDRATMAALLGVLSDVLGPARDVLSRVPQSRQGPNHAIPVPRHKDSQPLDPGRPRLKDTVESPLRETRTAGSKAAWGNGPMATSTPRPSRLNQNRPQTPQPER